ncbi:hypothetical protein HID58_019911 [Brassica napus]|uniref:Elongation factor P n=1 Tax=Brassica napus TaxID=3708 RepID=A0ABQ8DGQ6_BRANA|nr:hypothetical protein HID58_019911 [Brassica napus]
MRHSGFNFSPAREQKWREERLSLYLRLLHSASLIQLLRSHYLSLIGRHSLCGCLLEPTSFPGFAALCLLMTSKPELILKSMVLLGVCLFLHVKPGKGAAFVRTKIRNYVNGSTVERTFRAGISVEEANVFKETKQFTYKDGSQFVFMDLSTYEETRLNESDMGDKTRWLKEGMECSLLYWKDKVIDFELPNTVTLKVVDVDPGLRGDTAQGGSKPATVETGAVVTVPLFVNIGEEILVDTRTANEFVNVHCTCRAYKTFMAFAHFCSIECFLKIGKQEALFLLLIGLPIATTRSIMVSSHRPVPQKTHKQQYLSLSPSDSVLKDDDVELELDFSDVFGPLPEEAGDVSFDEPAVIYTRSHSLCPVANKNVTGKHLFLTITPPQAVLKENLELDFSDVFGPLPEDSTDVAFDEPAVIHSRSHSLVGPSLITSHSFKLSKLTLRETNDSVDLPPFLGSKGKIQQKIVKDKIKLPQFLSNEAHALLKGILLEE